MLYLTFLPLALWEYLDWATLFVAPLIAFLLAGVESIGVNMENPMKRLPMATYCKILHSNILIAASSWAFGEPVRPPLSLSGSYKKGFDQNHATVGP